ncbi:NADP-dependent oxidoreductase [Bacillus piscicola]|uniref:NADP-dependent oxidoreductase n=1 Tax=Bacillus piscicola TaxID=1632684 RepID=UPI001F093223|nr:NADP-dependent oxidoreductase [Bacillus piscicola]
MEQNEQIVLAERPQGLPSIETFQFKKIPLPDIQEKEVLVRTLYVSVDPYMRGRMQDQKSYVPPFPLGEVINGGVIGEVVGSRSDFFTKGDIVTGSLDWQKFSAVREDNIRKIDPEVAPISTHLGILGMPGLTAYFGLLDIGAPQKGETVVVSGAAGAVGSTVGQIAKIKGARVVGIAGTDEKTSWLKTELEFDEALNYNKEDDLQRALASTCPEGVDVYFDNVGGPISDAVLSQLNAFARVPVCGAISSYNKTEADLGPRIQPQLIKTRALIKGFIVGDYQEQFGEASAELGKWLQSGKLTYKENIVEGFEKIPSAFLGLFKGENVGKQIVKVGEPQQKDLNS